MSLQYSSEVPSNSAIVAAVIGGNLRAARSKTMPGDGSDNQLSRPPGYQSTYAWAYLVHAKERRDYHANAIAKMSPDDADRHVKEERERSLALRGISSRAPQTRWVTWTRAHGCFCWRLALTNCRRPPAAAILMCSPPR